MITPTICNSAPAEILSLIALQNKEKILQRNNEIIKNNLQILEQFFTEYAHLFEWVKPQRGCIGFVKYKSPKNVEDLCKKLVEQESVLLIPASIYDYPDNYFRIGFGRQNIRVALSLFKKFLINNNI